jgi:hypothetical protein
MTRARSRSRTRPPHSRDPVPPPDPEPTAVPSDLTMQLDRIEAAIASEAAKDEAFRIEVHAFTEELVRELKIVAGRFGL